MIRLSRFCSLVVFLVLGTAGCEADHVCTLIGCQEGLTVMLDGNFAAGTTYAVDISVVTPTPEVVPIMACSFTPVTPGQPGTQLQCSSSESHSEFVNQILIRDTTLKKVRVTVSSGGTQAGEQTFDVVFTSREINGSGCGTCTTASISVAAP